MNEETTQNEVVADAVVAPEGALPADLGITELDKQLDVERDMRCIPIAMMLFKEISAMPSLKIGVTATDDKERMTAYLEPVSRIIDEMLARGVKVEEIDYIFAISLQPFEIVKEIIAKTVKNATRKAVAQLLNHEDYSDITLNDVHTYLLTEKPADAVAEVPAQ